MKAPAPAGTSRGDHGGREQDHREQRRVDQLRDQRAGERAAPEREGGAAALAERGQEQRHRGREHEHEGDRGLDEDPQREPGEQRDAAQQAEPDQADQRQPGPGAAVALDREVGGVGRVVGVLVPERFARRRARASCAARSRRWCAAPARARRSPSSRRRRNHRRSPAPRGPASAAGSGRRSRGTPSRSPSRAARGRALDSAQPMSEKLSAAKPGRVIALPDLRGRLGVGARRVLRREPACGAAITATRGVVGAAGDGPDRGPRLVQDPERRPASAPTVRIVPAIVCANSRRTSPR